MTHRNVYMTDELQAIYDQTVEFVTAEDVKFTFDAAYAVEREKQRQRRSPPPTQKARRIKMTRKREPNKPDPVIYPGVPVSVPSRSPAVAGRERASARAPLELEKGRLLSDEERRLAREALESDRLAADIDLAERIRAAELRKSKRQQTKKDIKILDTASKIDVSAVSRGRTRGVKGPSHVAKGLPPISPSMGSASTSRGFAAEMPRCRKRAAT